MSCALNFWNIQSAPGAKKIGLEEYNRTVKIDDGMSWGDAQKFGRLAANTKGTKNDPQVKGMFDLANTIANSIGFSVKPSKEKIFPAEKLAAKGNTIWKHIAFDVVLEHEPRISKEALSAAVSCIARMFARCEVNQFLRSFFSFIRTVIHAYTNKLYNGKQALNAFNALYLTWMAMAKKYPEEINVHQKDWKASIDEIQEIIRSRKPPPAEPMAQEDCLEEDWGRIAAPPPYNPEFILEREEEEEEEEEDYEPSAPPLPAQLTA